MPILTWTPLLSVNIYSIDLQHKKLFEHINVFYDNLNKRSNKENLTELIEAMSDYTIYHFTEEENLMRQYDYPYLADHIQEHKEFIKTISTYKERINSGKMIISLEITNYLKNWITNHIMISDKKYSQLLASKIG